MCPRKDVEMHSTSSKPSCDMDLGSCIWLNYSNRVIFRTLTTGESSVALDAQDPVLRNCLNRVKAWLENTLIKKKYEIIIIIDN